MTLLDTPHLDAAVEVSSADAVPASRDLIVVQRTHPSQTVAGLAVLSHLANAPDGCFFDELYALFLHIQGGLASVHTTPQNLRGRLAHLESKGYVVVGAGRGDKRVYHLGDLSTMPTRRKAGDKAAPPVKVARAQAWCGVPAPMRQYDVMYGPVYAPPPSVAPRPGSLDFMRVTSHGYGC